MTGAGGTKGSVMRVRVGDTIVGLPLNCVRDVYDLVRVVPVPFASSAVRGLSNHRGRVTCVLSLGQMLGLSLSAEQKPFAVAVAWGAQPVSLEVDAVEGISDASDETPAIDIIGLLNSNFAHATGEQQ